MWSVALFSLAVLGEGSKHPIRKSLVDRINSGNSGWQAHQPEHNPLAHLSSDEIKGLMGLHDYSTPLEGKTAPRLHVGDIPESFDARETFASCQKPIRNQGNCGSCWAFAATETLTDNLCVLGQGNPALSAQDFVSCDSADHGCNGGTLQNVWDYIDERGAVSDSCIPYTSGDGSNATCPLPGCTGDGDSKVYNCPVQHSMLDSDSAIKGAVMVAGAVEVGFTVYEDFMNYKDGIYKHQEGLALGGHAVKIVGWGEHFDQFYWIVQNSWGASWGENGYFRIVNWHDDMDSGIAIGGGFACVDAPVPAPPSPAPLPVTCDDIASYCSDYEGQCAEKTYLVPVCKKTCGCCGSYVPSYCNTTNVLV